MTVSKKALYLRGGNETLEALERGEDPFGIKAAREIVTAAMDDDDENTNEIYIYDYIDGWGYNERTLRYDLAKAGDGPITIYMNSPGGSAFSGVAMKNLLRRDARKITVIVDAMCASAATIISMGADTIKMCQGSEWLVHRCWSLGMGDCKFFDKMAKEMRGTDSSLAEMYAAKTGSSMDDILDLMDEDRLMQRDEALELGFIDEIIDDEPKSKALASGDDDDKDERKRGNARTDFRAAAREFSKLSKRAEIAKVRLDPSILGA